MKYTTLFLLLFLFSCGSDETPRVVYPQAQQIDSLNQTSTQNLDLTPSKRNLYMEFPFAFDSTSTYIFPVRNTYDRYSRKVASDLASGYYPQETSRYEYKISGWFYNFLFQDLPSENLRKLTDQEMRFSQLEILYDTIDTEPYRLLVIDAYDIDSNQDKVLTQEDLHSYYLSNENGKNFRKITPVGHYPISRKFDRRKHRIYFNTIEDADRDGEFLKNDPHHYYYFEILTGKVKEYYMPQ